MPKTIDLCFNINGCPNKCKHCYLNGKPTGKMNISIIEEQIQKFNCSGYNTNVYSWYLEPDFSSNYKELYTWEQHNSVHKHTHFELASDYRLVRDPDYIKWLKELGLKKIQLTFFGLEELTNYYTDRKDAYKELLQSIEILLQNNIAPRIQYFVYSDSIKELKPFITMLENLNIEERCKEFNETFEFFIHQGSCTGRAIDLYDKWITIDLLHHIPDYVITKTTQYNNTNNILDVLGKPESTLYVELINSTDHYKFKLNYVFYIDEKYNIYPNFGEPTKNYKLGNLHTNSIEDIINTYETAEYKVGKLCKEYTIGELVNKFGIKDSNKLFHKNAYIQYLIDRALQNS